MFFIKDVYITSAVILILHFGHFGLGWSKECNKMPLDEPVHGNYLKNHIDDSFTDISEKNCVAKCFLSDMCQSINFENSTETCQLSISTRTQHPDDFLNKPNWVYVGTKNDCKPESCPTNRVCKANFSDGGFSCVRHCPVGVAGRENGTGKSCQEYYLCGKSSGVYKLTFNDTKLQAFCNQHALGGGWTTIQRRLDGSVDFYLGWQDYKNGFGNLDGEFWLGLDIIHRLTTAFNMRLRVELVDTDGNMAYAEYDEFVVAGEEEKYKLTVSSYSGTAGDSLARQNGYPFSTKDKDHDMWAIENCAVTFKGAWWYKDCHISNLNGLYLNGSHTSFADGINWLTWKGYYYSATRAEMMLRGQT